MVGPLVVQVLAQVAQELLATQHQIIKEVVEVLEAMMVIITLVPQADQE